MHGTVMGGGLEIALACHYRVAAAGTRFGMPEVTLGIIPGAGGTQRMPRLIGVEKALEFILSARPVDATHAVQLGFLDEVIEGDLLEGALKYTRNLLTTGRRVRRTGEMSVDPATATPEIVERMKALARKQYPNRNAGLVAIEAVSASVTTPFQQGLEPARWDPALRSVSLTPAFP
jgi:3-hydroxyacyl-CoA dehydrogenase